LCNITVDDKHSTILVNSLMMTFFETLNLITSHWCWQTDENTWCNRAII